MPDEIVGDLTNVQWAALARMFEKWPFRAKTLVRGRQSQA